MSVGVRIFLGFRDMGFSLIFSYMGCGVCIKGPCAMATDFVSQPEVKEGYHVVSF